MTRCLCVVAIAAFLGGLTCTFWSDALVHHRHRLLLLTDATTAAAEECCWVDLRIEWQLRDAPRLCARCTTNDALSNVLRAEGKWQGCDDLLVPLRGHLPEGGGLFVDVGANIGECTVLVAGQGFETHAFEAQPDNLRHLRASLARLPPSLVHLHAVALGGKVRTLDEEFPAAKPNILLMKLDAPEGLEVLRGARRLLAAGAIAAIKMELAPKAQQRELLCQLLDEAGFTLHHQHPHSRAVSVIVCTHLRGGGDLYAIKRGQLSRI